MIKKIQLFCLTLLSSVFANAQTSLSGSCGTMAPPQQWEDWMSKEVEKYKQRMVTGKTEQVNYTIPVIVHIIHFGETVGTYPNIDSNQINSQIVVLNNDFAGTGLNTASTPAPFAGHLAGNTGIKFCLAQKNPNGAVLPERGADRIDASLNSWLNPNTATLNIQNFMTYTVIPATIWDPTKYFNVWISDRPASSTLDGFARYPSGSTLSGLYSGVMGTATDDGVWCYTKAFGTIGVEATVRNEGRTMTHEVGHYFGLRHIWGDGNCLSDYCGDTPPAKTENTGCPPFPVNIDRCGVGQSPYGEMTMNHMDMTNDSCRYMFTSEQNVRMQVAISQGTNRYTLGADGLCTAYTAPSASAVPHFDLNGVPCVNRPFTPTNTSSGFPAPSFIWSSTPPANFSPNPTVANPAITFNSPGTYTLSLVATNTVSNATYTQVVSSITTCAAASNQLCIDTLRMIKKADSLMTYKAPNSSIVTGCVSGFAGYMTGNNCYNDRAYAQYYPSSSYSATPYPQINSVIVLFDSLGTKWGGAAPTLISCKIYGGSINYGPVSALATKQDSLRSIVSTRAVKQVQYAGNPNNLLSVARIIPYKFDFGPPAIINNPTTGFFVGIDVPQTYPGDSIRIYGSTRYANTSPTTDSSSWALTYNNLWRPLKSYRGARIQLAIMPQITCSPITGIKENGSSFSSNITLMPNPTSGAFNLVFTLSKEEELFIRVYNAVGEEVSSSHLKNVRNTMINLDLSGKPDGIYFTEISNGSERVVKKVIVTR